LFIFKLFLLLFSVGYYKIYPPDHFQSFRKGSEKSRAPGTETEEMDFLSVSSFFYPVTHWYSEISIQGL